ncbi:metallophosphoesterase [Adhaeribacter terreus]|uniref:Metallophosphoesterase n=1 Tax=Adhaeribacter terreus TaxID=529703 RepID=A0ABW0E787_9BACT
MPQSKFLDIIGDVHGCYPELLALLAKLGYEVQHPHGNTPEITHPEDRKLAFVGDFVDRGPDSPGVLKLVMHSVGQHKAFAVIGNHDDKLMRKLMGRNVQINHGLDTTLAQLEHEPPQFSIRVRRFLEMLPHLLWFDDNKLLIAHAGLPEKFHDPNSKRAREMALFGPTTGKLDEYGLPQRLNWAKDYAGKPFIVFGHTPVREPLLVNNTMNIDTGCVFGGKLTALRYPEMETVGVKPEKLYAEPRRPF